MIKALLVSFILIASEPPVKSVEVEWYKTFREGGTTYHVLRIEVNSCPTDFVFNDEELHKIEKGQIDKIAKKAIDRALNNCGNAPKN